MMRSLSSLVTLTLLKFREKAKSCMLNLTSGKILALSELLHVPNIRANLVSGALSRNLRVKVSLNFHRTIMTKNNVFVRVKYCSRGLFILNIYEIMNEHASSSFAYLIDSYDFWHAWLWHVSRRYIKKMQSLGLINNFDFSSLDKCQILATFKLTKKTLCVYI